MNYKMHPLGDQGILVEFGTEITEEIHLRIQSIIGKLNKLKPKWLLEYVPGFTSITIFYNLYYFYEIEPFKSPYEAVSIQLAKIIASNQDTEEKNQRTITVPVHYGGEFGPDIAIVATHHNMTEEEVIELHSRGKYMVYMIGFSPGFPYIGGMTEQLATPRKKTPAIKVPAGSVGIAGKQTGIYPLEFPGGWQIIGRTPLTLFNPHKKNPSLLKAGDYIKFMPISREEYNNWEYTEND